MRDADARRLCSALVVASVILVVQTRTLWAEDKGEKSEAGATGKKEEVDTEHIFGFSEGSTIGEKGEREIEDVTVGSFGKVGSYNQVDTETSFRYSVSDRLRLSVGTLTDAYAIQDVPGFDNRHAVTFSGVIGEARLNIVDNKSNPYGLSLSFNPSYRQFDLLSGQRFDNYTLPITLLFDKEIIKDKLFAAFNVIYSPTLQPAYIGPMVNDISVIAAATYAFTPKVFLGGEIRHENIIQGGVVEHALFLGPTAFYRVAPNANVKVAWAIQVPDPGARSLDLNSFERHQVELQFAFSF